MSDFGKIGSAWVDVEARTQSYENGLRRAETKTQQATSKMSDSFMKIGSAIGMTFGAYGAIRVLSQATDMLTEFDTGMRNVNTIINVSDRELYKLGNGILDIQSDLGLANKDLTNALYQTTSAGIKASEALGFVKVAGKAAIAGLSDTETAVDALTTVVNAWHLDTSEGYACSRRVLQNRSVR